MDVKGIRPIVAVKDPVRYPNIQNPIEKEAKASFQVHLNEMFVDLTKQLVKLAK